MLRAARRQKWTRRGSVVVVVILVVVIVAEEEVVVFFLVIEEVVVLFIIVEIRVVLVLLVPQIVVIVLGVVGFILIVVITVKVVLVVVVLVLFFLVEDRGEGDRAGIPEGVLGLDVDGRTRAEEVFRLGGDDWQRWNTSMKETLLEAQSPDGSWRPISTYAREYADDSDGDRSYSTAMCVLTLEIYYRYFTPLLKVK